MARQVYTTDKQVEAIAFELAKRTGGTHTMQDLDDLAHAINEAIHEWLIEGGGQTEFPDPIR